MLEKTFAGLTVEKAILGKAAQTLGRPLRLATPQDESRRVDGYIGDQPISVKPSTYKTMDALNEGIGARMIFYEKATDGRVVADITVLDDK